MICFAFFQAGCGNAVKDSSAESDADTSVTKISSLYESDEWIAPDTLTIPLNDTGNLIRYGRALVTNTGFYFGPSGIVSRTENGMNCQNCHLDAGTRLYANPYNAVFSIYPKFRARSGSVEHLEKRINDCMERSMNGNKLDSLSKEMRAMVAYINWVGKDVKKGTISKGAAVGDLTYLKRPADPEKGKIAFQNNCIKCHGMDGKGQLDSIGNSYYLYPPLWGSQSYNTAAGLYRLSRLAGFIKSNMPNLTSSHEKPTLTDEEAWDIAAFISSQPRPDKKYKNDWPDISKKPYDHPFGPYADNFSEQQHKFGPFEEIIAVSKKK